MTLVERNAKAKDVISRVQVKLTGQDFPGKRVPPTEKIQRLDVTVQVAKLIHEATAVENLAQAFMGWCPYW
jgi:FKBP12-rapamycin complex-associated protein